MGFDIKSEPFKIVIVTPGKCFKSSISRKDKAILLVLNKLYIETTSIFSCYNISKFLSNIDDDIFIPVGNIDKIALQNNAGIVYRQRFYFKSTTALFNVVHKLNCRLVISNKFKITANALVNISSDLRYLEKYASRLDMDVTDWLTLVFKVLVYEACKHYKISSKVNVGGTYDLSIQRKGILDRAPFLCGSYNISKRTSSVLNFIEQKEHIYPSRVKNSDIKYGFTDKTVQADIRGGDF